MAEERKKTDVFKEPMLIGLMGVVVLLMLGLVLFASEKPESPSGMIVAGDENMPSGVEPGEEAETPSSESPETGTPSSGTPATETPSSETSVDLEALVDDDPHIGSLSAPVTIVAFSEYLCSYCRIFETTTLQELGENYISTGDVRFVFRDMVVHGEDAQLMHEAAECADDQGMFWQYHDKLFTGDHRGVDKLKQLAVDLGLDTTEFNDCLDTRKHKDEVDADGAAGTALGVGGTPTFFINGKKLVGAQPYEVFEAAIQAELAA
jgi:protein-disulfide isomerase